MPLALIKAQTLRIDFPSYSMTTQSKCQYGSVERFLLIDPIVSGLDPFSAKISLRVIVLLRLFKIVKQEPLFSL